MQRPIKGIRYSVLTEQQCGTHTHTHARTLLPHGRTFWVFSVVVIEAEQIKLGIQVFAGVESDFYLPSETKTLTWQRLTEIKNLILIRILCKIGVK